jgi:citrate synthase
MGAIEREPFKWHSTVSYKTVDKIVTRGYDTTELVEKGYGLADVIFIDFQARIPLVKETKMLNYLMILCLEDGLSTSAGISRFVAKGHAFMTQSVGASILAFGNAYGGFQAFGRILDKYLSRAGKEGKSLDEMAEILVKESKGSSTLGASNLMLKDPAAKRVFAKAVSLGVAGKYIDFQNRIVKAAQKASKEPTDLDMLGAVGATMFDLGFSPESTWGIIAITRSFGCGAHAIEEEEREPRALFGAALTSKANYDGPPDRPVPPLKDRNKIVRPGTSRTLVEWRKNFEEMKKLKGSGFSIVEEIEDPRKLPKVKK